MRQGNITVSTPRAQDHARLSWGLYCIKNHRPARADFFSKNAACLDLWQDEFRASTSQSVPSPGFLPTTKGMGTAKGPWKSNTPS